MSKHINKIFSMIQTELKSEKVELEKVELARKPQSIFSDAKKLDNKLDSIEKKMDKAYINYRSAYDQFVSASADIDSRAGKLDDDLSDVEDSAKEIGVPAKNIPDWSEAKDLVTRLQTVANSMRKLYPSL